MKETEKSGYRGYIANRPFQGLSIPPPVQNLIFRDYAAKNDLFFKLSANELVFPDCFLQLDAVLEELPSLEGVLICSLFALPGERAARKRIYDKFLESEASLHCVFENHVFRSSGDADYIEELISISSALEHCPKDLPEQSRA